MKRSTIALGIGTMAIMTAITASIYMNMLSIRERYLTEKHRF